MARPLDISYAYTYTYTMFSKHDDLQVNKQAPEALPRFCANHCLRCPTGVLIDF
jgi:hypothetical protein